MSLAEAALSTPFGSRWTSEVLRLADPELFTLLVGLVAEV